MSTTPDLYPAHPAKMEWHRSTLYNDTLVFFGGYSCLESGVPFKGGEDCYGDAVWFLNLTDHTWSVVSRYTQNPDDPEQKRQLDIWPKPRAYHSQVIHEESVRHNRRRTHTRTHTRSFVLSLHTRAVDDEYTFCTDRRGFDLSRGFKSIKGFA
jgi:hypothetical protein